MRRLQKPVAQAFPSIPIEQSRKYRAIWSATWLLEEPHCEFGNAGRQTHSLLPFLGRDRDMEWLFNHFRRRSISVPIVICGPPGVGKTTLLKQFLSDARMRRPPLVLTTHHRPDESLAEITARTNEFFRDRDPPEIVAIDDAEAFNEQQLNLITGRILNFKAVRLLIFVMRHKPDFARAKILQLQPLSSLDSENTLRNLLGTDFPAEIIQLAATVASGLPLALGLLAELIRTRAPHEINSLLRGELYDLNQQLILPEKELITEVKPRIMLANQALVENLRQQPDSMYQLQPRKFEELIAELLADLGYDVELTPATRDGGKDILAQMTTPHGDVLCLVEVKKHRADRPVGVELVRQLYGTLVDADATSAMLVTTSSFSSDARMFQQRHQFKLALKDYADIVRWIDGYNKIV